MGCVRNQQVQVTDVEFYYATQSKNSVIKITRATVSQTIVSKTKDFEKINKNPDNYKKQQVYHLTYDTAGNYTSDITYSCTWEPFFICSEDMYNMIDGFGWTYYLNPMRFHRETALTPTESENISKTGMNIVDIVFNNKYWSSKITSSIQYRFVDSITQNVAEQTITETLTITYSYAI